MPTPPTLQIDLLNTTSSTVYASITGLALDDPSHTNSWFLLRSDGRTPFFPTSPSSILSPLSPATDYAVPVPPNQTVSVHIPHLAGARVYFSLSRPIQFFLNPGPALVEPSVTNPSDPNFDADWAFCEFTFNADQLYANVSYVDFVGVPVSLSLTCGSGEVKEVRGMSGEGRERLARGLEEQSARDGKGWKDLVVRDAKQGKVLRVLSPNQAMVMRPEILEGYFEKYVEEVWARYRDKKMHVDTQASFGVVRGGVRNENTEPVLDIDGQTFTKPSTHDIFNASSGPFATGADAKRNAIIPRLNAAFNRSTLLSGEEFPASQDHHYRHDVTNHYARLVHECNLDGRGYAHPYDDVAPSGGPDQSGFVNGGDPKVLKIVVGGPA